MISVIIPVYNGEKYLERCVASVLAQTYTDLEILLIEDCSTDNSAMLCAKLAEKDARIRVHYRKENGGIYNARNDGIRLANGEFLTFIDDDDYIDSNMYEILLKEQERMDTDYTACDFKEIVNGKEVFHSVKAGIQYYDKAGINSQLIWMLVGEQKISCAVWKTLFRKEIIINHNLLFKPSKVKDDFYFTVEYLLCCNSAQYIPVALYNYVIRKESTIHIYGLANIQDIENSPMTLYDIFEQHNALTPRFYHALGYEYVTQILRAIQVMDKKQFAAFCRNDIFRARLYWKNLGGGYLHLNLIIIYLMFKLHMSDLLYCLIRK